MAGRKLENTAHGAAWLRGSLIGRGGFGSVYLSTLKQPLSSFPSTMGEVLNNLKGCSYIIQCFGGEITMNEKGDKFYNLLLEHASGGSLAKLIRKSGGLGLPESKVRRYTKCILCGIKHIHQMGYAHLDLKPANILLAPQESGSSSELIAKICDFGLAKRVESTKKNKFLEGTATYISPEAVVQGIQEAPSDIWALGCVVLEMLTGKRIPDSISDEGKEFLKACFVRKAEDRLTAEKLNLPFVAQLNDWQDAGPSTHSWGQFCLRHVGDVPSCSSLSSTSENEDDSEGDGSALDSAQE
ncbi:Mitogen-activated protein kinase kinase kinase [Bertholletia excelsa]